MGDTQSNLTWETCSKCEQPFSYSGEKPQGAKLRCSKCKQKHFACSQCKRAFLSEVPISFSAKKDDIVCERCAEKKREIICSSCSAKIVAYEDHKDRKVNCEKCADIQQSKLKSGKYEKYQVLRKAEEVSIVCPKGLLRKPEEVVTVFNGQLQILDAAATDEESEVGPQPHHE